MSANAAQTPMSQTAPDAPAPPAILYRKSFFSTLLDQALVRVVRLLTRRRRSFGAPRMFLAPDEYIGETILAEGIFEKGYLGSVARILEIAEATGAIDVKGGVGLDIGANIGNHSLFFARYLRRIHSFEPNPMIGRVLEANMLLNPALGERVTVHRVALSNEDETLPYVQHDTNHGESGFDRDSAARPAGATMLELHHAGRFVAGLLEPGERLACVKIDVEGLEDKVMEGLAELLRRDKPLVFTEVTEPGPGARMIELLECCGYDGLYEIHNPSKFGSAPLPLRIARAMRHQVTYELRRVREFDGHIYPMLVAAPAVVIAAALGRR